MLRVQSDNLWVGLRDVHRRKHEKVSASAPSLDQRGSSILSPDAASSPSGDRGNPDRISRMRSSTIFRGLDQGVSESALCRLSSFIQTPGAFSMCRVVEELASPHGTSNYSCALHVSHVILHVYTATNRSACMHVHYPSDMPGNDGFNLCCVVTRVLNAWLSTPSHTCYRLHICRLVYDGHSMCAMEGHDMLAMCVAHGMLSMGQVVTWYSTG